MLPDFGWSELLVIAIVLIVIVGPKDLPKMLRTFGKTTSNLRKMAGDFRRQFDEALKEAELDDVRKIADDMRGLDPRNQIKDVLSPLGKVGQDISSELKKATTAPTPEKPKSSTETALDGAGDKMRAAQDTSKAAAKKPATKKPAAKSASAGAKKPAARKPVAKTAAAKKPAGSASAKSAAAKTAAKPKVPAKPAATKPAAAKTATAKTASTATASAAKPKAKPKAKKPAAEDKS
ncbi:Sec-independent protein translocase protein TatB [Oricola nitratireducens]|uniref:Sec-independent protein translocase protein TatB n=1 Tax=Oricola nitratireducens TaxID=2775868 RepID=UPI001867026A|nr:Sec-independent protein translocase protein TatB [Oricola nitratireducens]